jgi:hypothetical protein
MTMDETKQTETKIDGNRAARAAGTANGTGHEAERRRPPPPSAATRARDSEQPRPPREKAPPSELDQELRAMKQLGAMLAKIPPGVRVRVLRYFTDKYAGKGDK